jgi:hypothetical protein
MKNESRSTIDPAVQLVELDSTTEVARVTFQADNSVLRDQYEDVRTLPTGTSYALQHTGYGAVSCAIFQNGRAVILTIIPNDTSSKPSMSDETLVDIAGELVIASAS